jgi:hypothetical protein
MSQSGCVSRDHEAAVDPDAVGPVGLGQTALGEIEAALRSVNDRIRALAPRWDGMHDFVCECTDLHCLRSLSVSATVFDELRATPRRFAVVVGHQQEGSETVVTSAAGYLVVSRPGVPVLEETR